MPYTYWQKVKPQDFVIGERIFKEPSFRLGTASDIVHPITGACEKGIHYGNDCYDIISTWYRPVTV